ncbi:MAG: LacI family DNA-binding transcriptional regulator [bacterium]
MTEKRIKPTKLEDLAKILGVSKVTISKALRDHSDISDEMKIKVKKLAENMGYRPNMMARNLSSRRSNILGLVVPKIAHFFFSSIIEAIYDTAIEKNYESVIMVSQESAEREKQHIESLISMRVDGLIISITEKTQDISVFERVIKMNIPIVFIDRIPNIPNVPSVTVDDKGGAFAAVEHFIQKGYRKIGLMGGYDYINIGRARTEGFYEAMNKYNVPVNEKWIIKGGFGETDGYKGFKKMIESGEMPEAILAATYPVALGLYEAASEIGIKIPADVNVMCFGNNIYKYMAPSVFDFVSQPSEELGRQAVNLLFKLMNEPEELIEKNIELKTKLLLNGRKLVSSAIVA